MKSDLIIIIAHCPNQKKKDSLYLLLKNLQPFRENFNILLASHTNFDSFFTEMVDYFYYDKENTTLYDLEYNQNGWYSINGIDRIWSSFINLGNYLPAIYKILIPAISVAKSLGYKKIHKLEYDSLVINDKELKDNSKLLDKYDYVIYKNLDTNSMSGNFISFNVDRVIELWETYDLEKIKNLISKNYPKNSEIIVGNEIIETRKVFEKNLSLLLENGNDFGGISSSKNNWSFPYYDYEDGNLYFFNKNFSENPFFSEVIVNNSTYLNFGKINKDAWSVNLIGEFKKIEHLTVLKDKEVLLDLDFSENLFREKFIYYNFLEKR